MASYDKETLDLDCPGCKRPLNATYYDAYSKGEAKCQRCGSGYTFDSGRKSQFRSALQNLEQAQKKVSEALQHLVEKAEITIKKK